MKKLLYISFLFLGVFTFGQEGTIYGNVTSSEDVLPLPGVTIIIETTEKGTQTNFDGNYSIVANVNDTLVFSLIGYKTQKIRADKDTINVVLQEEKWDMYEYPSRPFPEPKPEVVPVLLSKKEIRKLKRELRKKPRAKKNSD
ncbi:MAG TPA: carboxypeptidase-like regulatory domain-containing protein [Flavobacterium sp.]|nr:carboxypeptidase-like regulatory domain-containing protein [Flavobacterium sp.]